MPPRPEAGLVKKLFTFGYEGLELEAFVSRLEVNGVGVILDVRELPLSRKKGFSKKSLGAALHENGILYLHLPALGCPKPIRDRYRQDGDWERYSKAFLRYLGTQGEALDELAKLASEGGCCLLCFEADHTRCHRTYVARAVAERTRIGITHITSRTTIPEMPRRQVA